MPTANETLYAVWTPRSDIVYTVEHWLITGDGTFSPLDKNGNVIRDANGALVTGTPNTSADASDTTNAAYRVTYNNGKSDVVFDLDAIGGYVRTVAGYTYLLNNASFTIAGATGTTNAVKTISADGKTVFYLFYRANENTIRFEVGSLGTIDGGTLDATENVNFITQKHYTDDSFDLATVPTPTRPGYDFLGWTIADKKGTDPINDAMGYTAQQIVTWLEAQNTGKGTYLKLFFKSGTNFTYLTPTGDIILRAVWTPQLVDYTINRWKVTGNGDKVELDSVTYKGYADTEVRFDAAKTEYKDGITYLKVDVPTGYRFLAAGTSEIYTGTNKLTQSFRTDAYGNVLPNGTAKFTLWYLPKTFKLELELGTLGTWNDTTTGTNTGTLKTVEYDAESVHEMLGYLSASRPGYTLVGWSSSDFSALKGEASQAKWLELAASAVGADWVRVTTVLKSDATGTSLTGYTYAYIANSYENIKYMYTMGLAGVKFYAVWRANDDTVYYVDHVRWEGNSTAKTTITEEFRGMTDKNYTAAPFNTMLADPRFNTSFTGYGYNGTDPKPSTATKAVTGDGTMRITLNYFAQKLNLTLESTGGTWSTTWNPEHLTESSFNLPTNADIKRPGYTLVGWSTTNPDDGLTGNIKGLASQVKAGQLAAITGNDTANGGANWITVATTSDGKTYVFVTPGYKMPTRGQTLYAVWYANNDTKYAVERWVVSGDGVRYALKADGTLERDANGLLVTSDKADSAHSLSYVGTTDEEAWADAIDGSIVYRTNDTLLTITGYAYAADGETIVAKDGVVTIGGQTLKTDARATINGDGKMTLVLYFKPLQFTLDFYIGATSTPNLSATPARATLYADQTYTLPTSTVTRSGYTLKGWTNSQYASGVDAATIISDLKGIKSQNAYTAVSASTGRDAVTGKVFTAVTSGGQTLYIMPTGNVTLYATWRANDDTQYLVERWVVSGDGTRYAVTSDGKLVRDANGKLVTSSAADASHVVKHVGITDEEAWADANVAGTSYRNDDSALTFAGYAFAANGETVIAKDGATAFTTIARKVITGDGKMVLVLYYKPKLNTITFNFGSGTSTGAPATMQVYTDQTVELSADAERTGYDLVGWSNVPTYSVKVDGAATATTVNVGTSKGLASQAAADAAKANTKRTSDKGAAFTAVTIGGQTLYIMPTDASITLYATWRAKSDTVFYVDRYKVTGDGVVVPIDANGKDLAALVSLRFTGVTDETATAGAKSGPKPWNTAAYGTLAGYYTIANGTSDRVMLKDGSGYVVMTTISAGVIVGDGSLHLVVYYFPLADRVLDLDVGDGTWEPGKESQYSGNKHATESSFTLPTNADVKRPGYTLVGWAIDKNGLMAAGKDTAKGAASQQSYLTLAAGKTGYIADGGAEWIAVISGYDASTFTYTFIGADDVIYVMPTNAKVMLRAVWRANDNTPYYVSRWGINGDGIAFPFKQDGTVDMNGDQIVIHDDPAWIKANYVVHYGITDEIAWADANVDGVSYRNADNIEVNGYRYLPTDDPAFDSIGGNLNTMARAVIKADGSMVLMLYYNAKDNITYSVYHVRVTGDGTVKNLVKQEFMKKNNSYVTVDNLDYNGLDDSRFLGYEYVDSIVINGVTYYSHIAGNVYDGLILYRYYKAIYDEGDKGIHLELNPGMGIWVNTGESTPSMIPGTSNSSHDTFAAETTITLPGADQLYRPGYEFVGWSDMPDGADAKGNYSVITSDHLMSVDPETGQYTDVLRALIMSLLSQRMEDAENRAIEVDGDNPTYKFLDHLYIAPDGKFLVPTKTIRLHAIWRARTDTKYTVSHWWVDQYGVAHEIEDSRLNLEGMTDENVYGSKLDDNHEAVAGYTYVKEYQGAIVLVRDKNGNAVQETDEYGNPLFNADGLPIFKYAYQPAIDAFGTLLARGIEFDNLNGDGSTHLRFYYIANNNTRYYVERWVITGDGTLVPLKADGTVPHDANGNLLVHDAKWAEGQRLVYVGFTGEMAWADGIDASVTYRHLDNIPVLGYTYLPHGQSVTIGGRTFTTQARAMIAGDGSTVLVLYYVFDESTLVLDPANGLWTNTDGKEGTDPAWSAGSLGTDPDAPRKTLEQLIAEQIAAATKALYAAGGNIALDDPRRLPITLKYGTDAQIMLPTADQLLRNGYVLIGFVDGNGRQYAPGYIFTMPSSSIRLMALWAPIIYTITFDKNDDVATGTAPEQRYEYGSAGTRLDDVDFERRNGTLLGWAFSPDAAKPDFTVGQLMSALLESGVLGLVRGDGIDDPATAMYLLAAMAGNGGNAIKLYAIWDVERHVAGLEGFEPDVDDFGHFVTEGEYPGGKITIDSDGVEPGFTLSPDDVLIELNPDYYIKGWNVIRDGVTTYIEGADAIFSVTMDSDVIFAPVFGNYAEEEAEERARYLAQLAAYGTPRTGDDAMGTMGHEAAVGLLALLILVLLIRRRRQETPSE